MEFGDLNSIQGESLTCSHSSRGQAEVYKLLTYEKGLFFSGTRSQNRWHVGALSCRSKH
ncbi:hypothetical protein BDW67DRAFT_164741 [Aspergillus spinulosporus]